MRLHFLRRVGNVISLIFRFGAKTKFLCVATIHFTLVCKCNFALARTCDFPIIDKTGRYTVFSEFRFRFRRLRRAKPPRTHHRSRPKVRFWRDRALPFPRENEISPRREHSFDVVVEMQFRFIADVQFRIYRRKPAYIHHIFRIAFAYAAVSLRQSPNRYQQKGRFWCERALPFRCEAEISSRRGHSF